MEVKKITKSGLALIVMITLIVSSTFLIISESMKSVGNKISTRMREAIEAHRGEKISAFIWIKDVDLTSAKEKALFALGKDVKTVDELMSREDLLLEDFQKYIQIKRETSRLIYNDHNIEIAKKLFSEGDIIYISEYSPVILACLNSNSIESLSKEDDVNYIDIYYREEHEIEMSTANAVTRASLVYNSYGYGGYGVKIGVLEDSITNGSFPGINIASQNGTVANYQKAVDHANSVVAIITSIAPDATYYIADHSVMSDFQAIEWLLNQGVNIINASKYMGNDGNSQYGSVSMWIDHIAYNHDVHFVTSSGNAESAGVTSGGMAYNAVTVGAIDDRRTISYLDDDIAPYSSFYFDTILDTHLANKPDICAPGGLEDEGFELNTGFEPSTYGTSYAAPQVTGAIALLCQGNPTLTIRQDAVKAILTCSVNFSSPLAFVPSNYDYKFFGAGLLDTCGAVWVAENTRYIASSIGSNTATKAHSFYVSSSDDRIRLSLAFLRNSTINANNHPGVTPNVSDLSNLNIAVYPPNSSTPIAVSNSSYNNVEIVDFEPTVAGTYTVVVTNTSASATTYYGLAWR